MEPPTAVASDGLMDVIGKLGTLLLSRLDGPEYRLFQDEVLMHRLAKRETG